MLGLLEAVRSRFPRILVAQQVYDELSEARDALKQDRARRELMMVGLEHGEMVRTVVTVEQLDATISFLADILRFCDEHGQRVGRARPLSERESKVAEMAGEATVAPMVVAGDHRNEGARLFSNEAVIRILGRDLAGAEGFGVLAFLTAELESQRMEVSKYADAIHICLRRMRHVPIIPKHLSFLVCAGRPIADYVAAVEALLGPDTERNSALVVATLHIRDVAVSITVGETPIPYLDFLATRVATRYGAPALRQIRQALLSPRLVIVPAIERAAKMLEAVEKMVAGAGGILPV